MGKQIITFDGTPSTTDKCAFIKGDYYIIGDSKVKNSGQCFELTKKNGETFKYRINSGKIAWDWEIKEYIIIEESNVVYGFTPEKMGYFTKNNLKNVEFRPICPIEVGTGSCIASTIWAFDEETVKMHGAELNHNDGYWYFVDKDRKITINNIIAVMQTGQKLPYSSFESVYSLDESRQYPKIVQLHKYLPVKVTDRAKELYKLFGGLSFGSEFETRSGRLQEKDLFLNGLVPLKDGSIDGHEYVSVPSFNEKGLQTFLNGLEVLQKSTTVNQSCSLHYHIGNILEQFKSGQEQKLFLLAIYNLYQIIQNQIWDIMPPYKRSMDYFKTKPQFKDHCKDLKSFKISKYNIYKEDGQLNNVELNKIFNIFYSFWNDGQGVNDNYSFEKRRHVKEGRRKWDFNCRYYALNLFNTMFSKSNTIEFRAHSGTVNKDKSLSWLLICIAIVRFAKKYTQEIIQETFKPTLSLIIEEFKNNFGENDIDPEFGEFVVEYLKGYVNSRESEFIAMYINNDIYGKEFKRDPIYSFKIKGKTLYDG